MYFVNSQVRKKILEEEIHCPPEASVLLASYAVHAKVSLGLENCVLSQIGQCILHVCFINLDLALPRGNPTAPPVVFFFFGRIEPMNE